jgi:hypothetical protein
MKKHELPAGTVNGGTVTTTPDGEVLAVFGPDGVARWLVDASRDEARAILGASRVARWLTPVAQCPDATNIFEDGAGCASGTGSGEDEGTGEDPGRTGDP